MSPPPATPGGGMKIILKRSQPPAPAIASDSNPYFTGAASVPVPAPRVALPTGAPTTVTTQKGRVSKPTAKKRARDMEDSDEEMMMTSAGRRNESAPKRPKLIVKKALTLKNRTASIVLKQVAKEAPPRSKGEGYDSEEDEREPDPLIEEEFVLRMLPGEHCDYLRRMIEERKIGVPLKDGGADFQLKWLASGLSSTGHATGPGTGTGAGAGAGASSTGPGADRRALVTVKGQQFVGVLVDLPTITEGMKSWDKRNFMKSADICQMLLVFARVADEAEARAAALPAMVTKDYRWPHGLTPPMHDCVHRRFRKRLSKKEIKDKEAELQRLLNEDKIAIESKWELFDDGRPSSDEEDDVIEEEDEDAEGDVDAGMFGDEDADGEADLEYAAAVAGGGEVQDIDEAELMAEFMEDEGEAAAGGAARVGGAAEAETPARGADEEEDDDEDDDDDDDDDMDEDEQARAEQAKGVREDINDLKKNLENLDAQLAGTTNALLRKRIEATKKKVMSELRLKQASIGEIDEE